MSFKKLMGKYKWWVALVTVLGLASNVLSLMVPRLSGMVVDHVKPVLDAAGITASGLTAEAAARPDLLILAAVAVVALLLTVIQIFVSTYFSEKVALDLRGRLIEKLGDQTFDYISTSTPGRLLTIVTSDVDQVKYVVAEGLVTLLGAAVTLVGSGIFLVYINVRLGLYTLAIIPFLVLTFLLIFRTLAELFRKSQENLEDINSVINESVVGSALIRVLGSASYEVKKFMPVNAASRDIGLAIVKNISALIPAITFLSNAATLIIVWFGGLQVMAGTLTVGSFSAFLSYSAMFIWPLFVLSFVGTSLSRGFVSLKRISTVLDVPILEEKGSYEGEIRGAIEFRNVTLRYVNAAGEDRTVLKDVSFVIPAGTKNAIVGPTAAGKTQLFYLMAGLVQPTEGTILIDGKPVSEYKTSALLSQIGLVFQDSIMFNTTFRENVALTAEAGGNNLDKALKVAELDALVSSLPSGLDTQVSERGTSLSGGQKQRLMLARALAVNPKVLLLDDFTARVDRATEEQILKGVIEGYPDVTLVSITQKVEPIKSYDQIIVLMEGEMIASGTHEDLLKSSFEYGQIYESQQTTNA